MRAFLLAFPSLFIFTSSASAIEVKNEYELNKPFAYVTTMLSLPSSDKTLTEKGGGKLLERKLQTIGFIYSAESGWEVNLKWKRLVERDEAQLEFVEVARRTKDEIVVQTQLVTKHRKIRHYFLETRIKRVGEKTLISNHWQLNVGNEGLFARAVARVKLRKMEEAVREIVGDPLPEEEIEEGEQ